MCHFLETPFDKWLRHLPDCKYGLVSILFGFLLVSLTNPNKLFPEPQNTSTREFTPPAATQRGLARSRSFPNPILTVWGTTLAFDAIRVMASAGISGAGVPAGGRRRSRLKRRRLLVVWLWLQRKTRACV